MDHFQSDKVVGSRPAGTLGDAGVAAVPTAFQAPSTNALAERLVQSIKRECLERLILFGSDDLQRALQEFVAHHHLERPHQGLGNRALTASTSVSPKCSEVVVDERLGANTLPRLGQRWGWRYGAASSCTKRLGGLSG